METKVAKEGVLAAAVMAAAGWVEERVEGVRMGAAWGWATWVAAEGKVVGRAASVMLAEVASEVAEMVAACTGVAMVLETADTVVTWAALMEVVVAREATVVGVVGLAALKVHPA